MTTANALIEYVPALRRYALMLTQDRETADDLVQETLARAIEHLPSFQPGTNLRAWLVTILRNFHLNNNVRRGSRVRTWNSEEEEEARQRTVSAPQDAVVALRQLWQAMAKLPADQRETLLLIGMEEFSYEEAAEIAGVPIGTIRSRLHRARTKLLTTCDYAC